MASGAEAGDVVQASTALFPAATVTTTPAAAERAIAYGLIVELLRAGIADPDHRRLLRPAASHGVAPTLRQTAADGRDTGARCAGSGAGSE